MSGTLPAWMERWLGLNTSPGEGTVWQLEAHWPWPPWVRLLFVLFAVAFVVGIYLREGRQAGRTYRGMLAAIRLALIGLALVMIAQLSVSFQRTGLPYVAVVMDDSLSMTIVDRYEGKVRTAIGERLKRAGLAGDLSRWNLGKTLLTEQKGEMLSAITDNYKLKFYWLAGARASRAADVPGIVEEIRSLQPTGESTRLGGAVRAVLDDLRGTAPAAIVVVTDGINTDGPSLADAAAYARRKGVPLFFIGLGSDQPVRDLKLSDLLVDDVVFVNDIVNLQFKLAGTGFQGTKVAITLRQEGKSDVLARTEATVGPDGQTQEVRLAYRPTQVGQFRYTVEVAPQEGEQQTENNRLGRTIQVRKQKIRVLLVQSYPSFEYRFLRNMLARDETVELHTVLQDADVEYAEQDKAALRVFPVRRDDLFAYDVLILGDADPGLLGPGVLQNVFEFVDQRGGALVLLAGPKYMPQAYRDTPLARLMPFEFGSLRYPDPAKPISDGFVAQPTELGLSSPGMQLGDTPEETRQIWQNLPPLYWMVEVAELKAAARDRVLAEHPTRMGRDGRRLPVIAMQYFGAGKVLFQATDETWRWRRRVGDVFFARYWIQTLRWLSRSKLVEGARTAELTSDLREYHPGDPVRLRVRFVDERQAPAEDDGVTVVLEHQGHKTQRLQLRRAESGRGIFEGALNRAAVGSYHAWIAVPTMEGRAPAVDFVVAPPPGEFARVRMETTEMRQAAELTKGHFYTFANAERLREDLPEGHQVPIETLPPRPLWNWWPLLLVFLTLLIGEWLLRKRKGMV